MPSASILQFPATDKPAYTLVTDPKKAEGIVKHIFNSGLTHALDIETTSLHPALGTISLIQIHGPTGTFIIDCLGWESQHTIIKMIQCCEMYVFNAKFEGLWLKPHARLLCTGMMYRAMHGGNAWSLAHTVESVLDVVMNKNVDHSQWGERPLTQQQLTYAAEDAIRTYELATRLAGQMTPDHWNGFAYINNLYNITIEIEQTGLTLDRKGHQTLIGQWQAKADAAMATLRELVPDADIPNVNSRKQVSQFLRSVLPPEVEIRWPRTGKTNDLSLTRNHIELMRGFLSNWAEMAQFLNAYLEFSRHQKYLSSFGQSLADKAGLGGVIKSQYHAARAITTRYSCSAPNLQQIPKDGSVRHLFRARSGKKLVAADYSAIEVRTAAMISGDEALLEQCLYHDVHQDMADATGLERGPSKAVTFGVLYGSGAVGLAGRMMCSPSRAQELIDTWARKYPLAFNYRFRVLKEAKATGFITMPTGRQIYLGRKPSLSKCANYVIQSTAADVLHAAMHHLHGRLEDMRKGGTPHLLYTRAVAVVHDEILIETLPRYADEVEAALVGAMTTGWLQVFPGSDTARLIDSGVGDTWMNAKP